MCGSLKAESREAGPSTHPTHPHCEREPIFCAGCHHRLEMTPAVKDYCKATGVYVAHSAPLHSQIYTLHRIARDLVRRPESHSLFDSATAECGAILRAGALPQRGERVRPSDRF